MSKHIPAVGSKVSAYRLSDTVRNKRIVGTLRKNENGIAVLVSDGKQIPCDARSLKRARKVRHNDYRFGNKVIDTHVAIIGRG